MLKCFCTFGVCLFVRILAAQSLSPTVVNAAGGTIQNGSNGLEWSLGELAVSTLTSTNHLLTQGFLQPQIVLVPTRDILEERQFTVFPNPASSALTIQTVVHDIGSVQVLDILGRLALETTFQENIDLQCLEAGMYTITLYDLQKKAIHSFKIIKQ